MSLPRTSRLLAVLLPALLVACQSTSESDLLADSHAHSLEPGLNIVVTFEAGSSSVELLQGARRNLTTSINVVNESGDPVTVLNQTLIEPANGGITIISDYPSNGHTTSGSVSYVLNQSIAGLQAGIYLVTNRAFIPGAGIEATQTFRVRVLPPGGDPTILPLGAYPDAVPAQGTTSVTFTASITSFLSRPDSLSLRRVDGVSNPVVATLRDDGTQGDLVAGDGVYSARLSISSTGAGRLRYKTTATFPGVQGEVSSAPFDLIASRHPTTLRPARPGRAVTDPTLGVPFICDEVLVSFTEGVTPAEMDSIVSQRVGGAIVGSLPGLGIYQVSVPGPCTAGGLNAAIGALLQETRVRTVEHNFVGEVDEVVPSDPRYGAQYNLGKARADEAWVLARGAGVLVAVVDTGVNYNHEDLTGQVILGPDLIEGDNNPLDDIGHGTKVASIIAARGNNGAGMAGVAWSSKVLAIKAIDRDGALTTSDAAAAIKFAADKGAKVINCSWGFPQPARPVNTSALEEAVKYATTKGSIVVASAGNVGNSRPRFPCAYGEVLCVTATDASDTRWGLGNFGSHVDLAAPGAGIVAALMDGSYGTCEGTSCAAPLVSGSVAVVWSHLPAWRAEQVSQRLQATAVPLPESGLGSGRIDLFEAVFNGSFEDGISGWAETGTAGALPSLGPLLPQDRNKLAFLSSGPSGAQIQTTLEQTFTIQPGVTTLPLRFDYNFITEEYPEWIHRGYNDNMSITLVTPNGTEVTLAYEDVNTTQFTAVDGIDLPEGDQTVGTTGWKTASVRIPVTSGPGRYRIKVRDEGDGTFDSNLLIDNIRLK